MNHFLSVLFGELMGKIPPHEGKDLKLLMVTSTKSAPQIKSHQKSTDILVIAVVGWLGWLVGWLVGLVGWLVGSGLASSLRAKLGDTTDGLMEGLLTEGEARASGPLGGSTWGMLGVFESGCGPFLANKTKIWQNFREIVELYYVMQWFWHHPGHLFDAVRGIKQGLYPFPGFCPKKSSLNARQMSHCQISVRLLSVSLIRASNWNSDVCDPNMRHLHGMNQSTFEGLLGLSWW